MVSNLVSNLVLLLCLTNWTTVPKIPFVMAEITFKMAVMTSLVTKITFVVAEITFKVAVIPSSVAKITL